MDCSDKWKFDKVDKIFIAFISAFVAVFCVIETFCFADSSVDFFVYNGYGISNSTVVSLDPQFSYAATFEVIKGHTYSVSFDTSKQPVACYYISDVVPVVGESASRVVPDSTSSFTFTSDYSGAAVFLYSWTNDFTSSLKITDVTIGYNSIISSLVDNVGISNFWNIFENSVPYILVVTVFSLGFFLIITSIKGVSKGKGRL